MSRRVPLSFLLTIAVLLVASGQAATAQLADRPGPVVSHPASLRLWLSGPFGRVAGGTPEQPAVAEPGAMPLDAISRRAPLSLDAGAAALPVEALQVTATASNAPRTEEALSDGEVMFAGPDQAGRYVISVDLVTADGQHSRHAWSVEVPDQDPPVDGIYDIPAPATLLEGLDGEVAGAPGDGCYIYLCVDVGVAPPIDTLPVVRVAVDEPLTLRIGDGSAIVAWEGSLLELVTETGRLLTGNGVLTDQLEDRIGLAGLEVPGSGEWLLMLKVVFDRERGWLTTWHRLSAE